MDAGKRSLGAGGRRCGRFQPVGATIGQQKLRARWIGLDLLPQAEDVGQQRVDSGAAVEGSDIRQQCRTIRCGFQSKAARYPSLMAATLPI